MSGRPSSDASRRSNAFLFLLPDFRAGMEALVMDRARGLFDIRASYIFVFSKSGKPIFLIRPR